MQTLHHPTLAPGQQIRFYEVRRPDPRTAPCLQALRPRGLARDETRQEVGSIRQNHSARTAPRITRDEA